ncbi:Phosphate transport system regulatory protein PhoU [Mycoplasma haemofelis Ohio2]|uniref:Phosphate transport system regulatory protein PhoU n=1 Tax=Mycoplasma haemofelis (strain Ohio2) TaxID=859194 RepID=F6FHP6_MYCHI|nr:Phosphate transport system regulatory protein PhoU [Mycoplasma haemofelis Ohio2]
MATNPAFLKFAIEDCFLAFRKYFELTYALHAKVLEFYKDHKNSDLLREIKSLEMDSNSIYKRMIEEVAWNISQHSPQADSLRFFLALLLSLKDVERFADYGYSIARIINKKNMDLFRVFGNFEVFQKMLFYVDSMWQRFLKGDGKVNARDFKFCENLKNEFVGLQKDSFSKITEFLTDFEVSDANKDLSSFVHIVLVKIGRSVDHVFNVIENFQQIRDPNAENAFILKEKE